MLPVTSAVAALAAVALVVLSVRVSLGRMRAGVRIGFGDDAALLRRIRAQGNFIEYVPLALILLGLAEARAAGAGWLWIIAGLLVVGRALHAAGILTESTPVRASGMLATYGALLAGAAALAFG
jgi:uncharacterized membrane protein YecN with MAPEG domain